MVEKYEINAMEKEESWRLFRIMGELVEGFDAGYHSTSGYHLWICTLEAG